MVLIRLTYFSRNRLARGMESTGVAEIIAKSARTNLRNDITGVLVHDSRWFAQVLEGAESAVSLTFERILRDERHSDVILTSMQPIVERRYPACAMRGCPRGEDNEDVFRHYCEDDHFDPRQMRPDRLADLIEAVAERGIQGDMAWTGSATNVA